MKKLKRTLALTLVLCMLCSLLPVSVLAAETAPTNNLSTTGSPFQKGTGDSNSFRIPALVTLSDGTLVAAADARWNTTYDGGGLDTMVAISTDNGASWTHSFANYLGDNGNTYNGASSCFIDPSLAVYTTDVDNDGISEDTIYMLCDLYPNGVALNGAKQCTPSTQTGFNANGYLKLTTEAPSTSGNSYVDGDFTHYLKDGNIYSNDGTPVSGLSVDDYFNVTGTYNDQTVSSNLFFADSPFHVVRTGFLYLTKSTDGGESWSAPELLPLKTSSEEVCLVGPNGGMVTKNGVIVFPVYSYTGTTEQTGLIYSDDEGATWKRSSTFTGSTSKSSEADVVELDNGKLRVFYRNTSTYLCYADYDLSTNTWGNQVNTRVLTNSNTELSAITYSKSVIHNGVEKKMILVSCPASANLAGSSSSDGSWRTSGRIFAGLVDPTTCEMTWLDKSVAVTAVASGQLSGSNYTDAQGFFAYSSMTEKKDGSVYILYENNQNGWGAGNGYSYTITSKTFTESNLANELGVTFSGTTTPDEGDADAPTVTNTVDVSIEVGETSQVYTNTTGSTVVQNTDSTIASMKVDVVPGVAETTVSTTAATAVEPGATYIIRVTGTNQALTSNKGGTTWNGSDGDTRAFETFTAAEADNMWTLEASGNGYKLKCAAGYLNLGNNAAWIDNAGEVFTLTYANGVWAIGDGTYNIDALGGLNNYHCAGGWPDSGTRFDLYKVTEATPASTEVSFNGVKAGKTTAVVGTTQYNITVTPVYEKVNVELMVGTSKTYTHTTGNEVITSPNQGIAKMDIATNMTISPVTTLESGKQYIIANTKTGKVLTDSVIKIPGKWDDKTGLAVSDDLSANCAELWTVTVTEDGRYTISQNGKYLVASGYYADMSTTATGLNVAYSTEKQAWTIMDNVTKEAPTEYFLSANVGDNYEGGVLATSATNNEYIYWAFYEIVPANTEITFTGVSVGQTVAVVGNTQYNITVTPGYAQKDVMLKVGQSTTYSDDSGVYDSYTITDPSIVDVLLEGGTQPTAMTSITTNDTFYIMVSEGVYLTKDYGTTTKLEEAETWTVVTDGGYYYKIKNSDGLFLGDQSNNPVSVYSYSAFLDFNDGVLVGWYSSAFVGIPVKVTSTNTSGTNITFTAKAEGRTTVVVGKTQYNITVVPDSISSVVKIELEVGESYTYTDTSGNHSANIIQQPNGAYASMTVTGSANSIQKKLVPVTAKTFETGKLYVIENVRTANPNHGAYQPNDSVLTATEVVGGATGLDMNGPLDVATSQKWSFTPSDNMYFVKANGEYIHIDSGNASMETTAQSLSFEYVDGSGWLIYYNADGNNTSDDGDYFLSDLEGTARGEAFGYTVKDDDGNYWNIYELVTEQLIDATKVVFEGEAVGTTTAIVGSTQYMITVVPVEVDDEVQNTATNIWTVDPEIQRERYNSLIGLHKDLFTDASWKVYETARQAAYKKLVEVTNAQYSSAEDAEAALAELTKLIDQLVTAKAQLESAKTISVRYTLNGQDLDIREYKIGANDKTATLPDTIVVNNIAYKVTITELDLTGETGSGDTAFEVPVTVIGKLGGGFVGSQDITAGNHNGHQQVCDLVDDSNTGKKITEMTLTTGISYDLNLATDTTGMTVTWTTDNSSVATVDQNGNVTAVGTGTTNITATITDANGNVVEVNTIPVTVFPKGTADRQTAIYIEGIDNTTVWCVVNGDTTNYGFEVIEGELIYGQFDTTVSDGTKTTAMSFFGDPDEAHALVYMKSTNSDDHYFLLHDDDGNTYDGSQSGKASDKYYVSGVTSGAGWWQAVGLNDNQTLNTADRWKVIYDMVDWAVDLGCDGGLGFTRRQSEGALASNLTFASDPMPRIEKVVDGVLPTSRKQADYERYTPNMVAAVNELVYFKITITQEIPSVWNTTYPNRGAIEYTNAWVTDTILPGAYLYNKELDQADGTWDGEVAESSRTQKDEITAELNADWTDEQKAAGKRIFEYYLVYEIQESDIPKFYIDNIANLSYNYGSKYSKGAQAGTADAEARITVVGSAIDNVVIDFGQKVVYQGHDFTSITDGKTYTFTGLRNVHLKGAFVNGVNDIDGITKCHAEATYGDVEVTREQLLDENGDPMVDSKGYPEYEYIVTYTPTTILQGADAVRIYGMGENNQEKVINGFLVYPATTVYYEEGFMLDNNSSWDAVNGWSSNPGWDTTNAKAATVEQSFELLGMSQFDNHGMLTGKISNLKHNYGFDPIYDGNNDNGEAAKSWITADKVGDSTSFTFTGTGFELFADCTENSGYVNVSVVNAEGQTVKVFMVNTVVKGGDSSATTGQTGNMDSLPIVSLKDLPHGTYTVTLGKVMNDSKVVTIDGVRITNTIADSSVYTIDEEDNPEFYQLRDMVLRSLDIKADTSEDYGNLTGKAQQVYNDLFFSDAETEEPFAIITSTSEIYDSNDTQDLLDKGPKNEVYLWANQTLTFNVTTSRLLQVGLKAPRGATSYTIKVDGSTVKNAALETTVDLFYELGNTNGTEHTYTISITNTGSDILAITDLKICDDPNAKFEHITYDTIVDILEDAGYSDGEEPDVPDEPDEPEIPDEPMNFVDVPEGSYYYPPVVWAVKNGITNGISQSHFGSDMDCNRAQVVTFLWRAAGCPEPTITENPFVDVEAGSFYEKAVLWAVEKNITNGTDKTHFSPNLTCNRASVVTFLYRAFEEPVVEDVENPFTDVPAETWFTQPVLWAVEQEITNGIGGGLFGIDDMCNRAQIVTFLYRAYN